MAIAGHVSRSMIEHYSHIRMEAKRAALDAIAAQPLQAVIGADVHQNVHQPPAGDSKASGKLSDLTHRSLIGGPGWT